MKKVYQKPTVKVIEMKQRGVLCTTSYDGAPPFDLNEDF